MILRGSTKIKRKKYAPVTLEEDYLTKIDYRLSRDDQKFLAELRRSSKYDYKPDINVKKLSHSQKLIHISEQMLKKSDDPGNIVKAKIIHYLAGCDIDSITESEFHEQITADIELLNLP